MVPSAAAGSLKSRMRKLQKKTASAGLAGVLMAPGPNLRYYTGVDSHLLERPFVLFVPTEGEPHLVAPRLESGPYARSPLDIVVHAWDDASGPSGAFDALRSSMRLRGDWGCEGSVPFRYLEHVSGSRLKLELADPVLQGIRETKEEEELGQIRKASALLSKAFLRVPEFATAGMSELEVAKRFREAVFELGGDSVDFCSVQAGANAADPHWAPSRAKLARDQGFLIDAGCTFGGYNADITRTFVLGKNSDVERAYADVLSAQVAAVDEVKRGTSTGRIDAAARSRLEAAGRGAQFFHRTGHGLGLEIHERPYIVSGGREKIRPGMVFTVEPGVYVAGRYGVRIEDDVIAGRSGAEVTTSGVPKEYGWWK